MFFNVGSIFVALLIGIYLTVANSYDLMVKLTQSGELFDMSKLNDAVGSFTDSIYTLIAVFMLFRITVTMIEYLVDPDKLTDKSTGTGKLITRIIVSIILVIAFPLIMDNVVYPLQDALLSSDSIIFKFFNTGSSGGGTGGGANTGASSSTNYGSEAECKKNCNGTCDGSVCKTEITSETVCLSEMKKTSSTEFAAKAAANYGCKYTNKIKEYIYYKDNPRKEVTCSGPCSSNSYIIDVKITGTRETKIEIVTTNSYNEAANSSGNVNFDEEYYDNVNVQTREETDGIDFARSIIASFSSNPDAIYNEHFLTDPDGNAKIATMVEEEVMTIDLFISIICGIIVVFVILVLCIEVVIRNLKMIMLELLAPIAFISYMNPNDKVLNNWFQKFIGCYLDLFIKILAIRMAVYFISLLSDTISGLTTILVYIAIFLFAKTVPNLISDIFGIKNMGGTFKDSMGALKTAAFAGVGAAAGAGAGLVTGMGKGMSFSTVAGGLLGGAFRGAQGGMKGKTFQGAAEQAKRNNAAKQSNINGGNWWQRRLASVGMDDATRTDKKIASLLADKQQYDDFSKLKKNAEDIADGSDYMKDYARQVGADGNLIHSASDIKAERDRWTKEQLIMKSMADTGAYRFVSDNNGNYIAQRRVLDDNGNETWESEFGPGQHLFHYKFEAGKAAGIQAQIKEAEIRRSGISLFSRDDKFQTPITTLEALDNADKEVKQRSTQIGLDIAQAKSSDEYIAAEASRKKGN